jgi:uncharacterized membrane protein (DUF373 family)
MNTNTEEKQTGVAIQALSRVTVGIYLIIAIVLTILVIISFYRVGMQLIGLIGDPLIPGGVIQVLHTLLTTIILVEVLETVTAYFKTHKLLIRPILIAALTATVRRVLLFGVEVTDPFEIALTLAAIVVITFAIIYIGKEEMAHDKF